MSYSHIELGRQGYVKSNGALCLEVQRYAGNKPTVERVLGVTHQGDLRTELVEPTSSPRTGGGNGSDYYHLEDGIYDIDDILDTGSRTYGTYIALFDGNLDAYSRNGLNEVLKEHFAGDMAAAAEAKRLHKERLAAAQEILKEIGEERQHFLAPVTDGELTAHPEFRDLPSAESVVASMGTPNFDRTAFVMNAAAPHHFVIQTPVFAKASTPEQAFIQARATTEARKTQLAEAQGKAEEAGWPSLTGSEKQIRWAETIRAKVAAKDPKAKALKTGTTAKYWIDNHRYA